MIVRALDEVPLGPLAPGETRALVAVARTLQHAGVLDDAERAARDRLHQVQDRESSHAARVLLRWAVGRALGVEPAEVPLDRHCHACGGPHGAPRVVGSALQVSLSHTRGLVAVALHAGGPVGVDVEVVGPAFDDDALVRQLLSARERADGPWDRQRLARTWTAKEAVVKATGHGLTADLRLVDLAAEDVTALDVPEGFAGAVARAG